MKLLAATPLLTQIAARDLYAQAASAVGRDPRQNVYTRLGVKTVINCRGTWTYLSGSLEFPEVRAGAGRSRPVFRQHAGTAARRGQTAVRTDGRRIGHRHFRVRGRDGRCDRRMHGRHRTTRYIWQLPDTTGLKHEVIMVGGRSAFDSAIRLTGAKLVLVYSPDELAQAINENTAMIYTTDLGDKLQKELGDRQGAQDPDVAR